MIAIANLPFFHRIFKFSRSLKIFKKKIAIILIASRKKKKIKMMHKIVAINIFIKTQFSNCKETRTFKEKMRKRMIKILKRLNLCILENLAKTLTNLLILKSKEEAITLKLNKFYIAEKMSAIRAQRSRARVSRTSIRNEVRMKDFKKSGKKRAKL
jgi:hypothetical protein